MKFNWGTGIFIFYSLFAASLFYQVYKSTQYDHSLVADNYYEKDLAYQAQFDKKANSLHLENKLEINYKKETALVEFLFPKEIKGINGKVLFYRADDKKLDVELSLLVDENNEMKLDANKFSVGFWNVEVDWNAAGKAYFDEKTIKLER